MAKILNDKEGYPLTPEQFRESEERCVEIIVDNNDIPAFEKAAYRAMVRFIRVDQHLKEENPPGQTKFFTKHLLERDLFRFGKVFQEERAKEALEKAKKWDKLEEKISKFYEEGASGDLGDIGEAAAAAFGYL